MNTASPEGKGKASAAPVAALFVALLILVAAIAYVSFSTKHVTSTSSLIASSTNQISTSYSTSSLSSIESSTTSSSSSNAVTTFQSMPITSYPPAGTFDPDDGYTYVSNAGNGTVSVISSSTDTVLVVLRVGSLGSSPSPPVLDPANGELFVSLETQNTVVVISKETVVATLPVGVTGSDPLTPLSDPQNGEVYVPTDASGFLSVISGATNTVVANVTVGTGIVGAGFDPANGDIYLTGGPQGGVALVISGETNMVVGNLTLDFGPSSCPWVDEVPGNLTCAQYEDGPSSPVFDSANGDIYVSNGGGDTVSVISGATNSLVTNVGVGGGPMTPTIDSANGDVYIANFGSSSVSVISSVQNVMVANLTVGNQPFQVLLNPMNGDIYVPSATQDSCGAGVCIINSTLSIISGATNTIVATVPICMDPTGTTVDSSNGDVYVSCQDGTNWVVSSTTLPSSGTSTQQLGEILPECGTPFNTLLNPAPKGTVYLKVVMDQGGTVVTNGTLFVTQAGSFRSMTYCISMSDVNGTGYIQLAPVNFNGTQTDFITSGYYNVTLWVGSYNPNITNNPPPSYWATIPSIQVQPNSTTYVTVSVPSGMVIVVTSNEGSGAVTTTTTSATTTKVNGP